MTGPMLDCVILAGAPADDDLKARYNVNWRAEAPVAGRRMADRVLDALRDSGLHPQQSAGRRFPE